MDIDGVYGSIGELGPAQARLFVLLSLPSLWMGLHALITNFIGTDPGWTCTITNSKCSETGDSNCTSTIIVTDPVEKCRHYDRGDCTPQFDTSQYTSVVSEWELICGRSSYPNLSQSAYFLGHMSGSWMFGALADMYGRKKLLFFSLFGCTVIGVCYSQAHSFLAFVLFRFFFGILNQAQTFVAYNLLIELVGSTRRSFVAMFSGVFYPCGLCVLTVLAYYIRSWRALTLFNSVLGFGFLPLWRFIPESPRWLLVQGREDEAKAVLAKIARGNGRNIMTVSRLKIPTNQSSETTTSVSIIELFRERHIRTITLILMIAWFTNTLVYYGLSLNAGSLGGGRYISVALSGLADVPAHYVAYVSLERIGRRWSHGGMLMLAGVCCGVWAMEFLAGAGEALTLVTALLGKCAVAASFSSVYLYTAELFPTEVRILGMGVVSISSRLGGLLTPILLLMGGVSLGLPMALMGSLGLLAGLLSLYLPETLNQPLPETLSDLAP